MTDSDGIKGGTVLPVSYQQSSPTNTRRHKKSSRRKNQLDCFSDDNISIVQACKPEIYMFCSDIQRFIFFPVNADSQFSLPISGENKGGGCWNTKRSHLGSRAFLFFFFILFFLMPKFVVNCSTITKYQSRISVCVCSVSFELSYTVLKVRVLREHRP